MITDTQYPKVVVIGAGSLFFGRQAIWQMVHSPHLNRGTLALVDNDRVRLDNMARLAEMLVEHTGVSLKIEAAYDWKDVLPGSDFVVLSFADRTVHFRGLDCAISEKYGVRMCSGDTIGPGGIFRAMRELPAIMECARDIERMCPDAWVINYINPTAVNGIALTRYAPTLKSFALCDSLHMPNVKKKYAQSAGIIQSPDEWTEAHDSMFDLRIAGVNHFTWMIRANYDGKDMMPIIAEQIRLAAEGEINEANKNAKAKYNNSIAYQLYEIYGNIPTCVAHTKEYVRFYQGNGPRLDDKVSPLAIWETGLRYELHDAMWREVDAYVKGNQPIADFMIAFGPDHATDIIENMVGNLGRPFYVNVKNRNAVTNMDDDAFLELLCDIDMNGPKPRPVGEMPRGLRGQQQVVLDAHEMTAEAIVNGDFALLRRAMMTDPLTNSVGDADAIIRELLAVERDALPCHWFAGNMS